MSARTDAAEQVTEASIAAGASARVGAILSKAEERARSVREAAEQSAGEARQTAHREAEQVAEDARRAAEAAARDRVTRISELRASIAARAGSLVEGLEGGELTAARLEELVEALGEASDRILEEMGGGARTASRVAAVARQEQVHARPNGRPAVREQAPPASIPDPLPEGAPIARRPGRSNARAAAVLMAIQGIERDQVAERLEREHGLADSDQLLDDVFGRADAPA